MEEISSGIPARGDARTTPSAATGGAPRDLRQWIARVEAIGQLKRISAPVSRRAADRTFKSTFGALWRCQFGRVPPARPRGALERPTARRSATWAGAGAASQDGVG